MLVDKMNNSKGSSPLISTSPCFFFCFICFISFFRWLVAEKVYWVITKLLRRGKSLRNTCWSQDLVCSTTEHWVVLLLLLLTKCCEEWQPLKKIVFFYSETVQILSKFSLTWSWALSPRTTNMERCPCFTPLSIKVLILLSNSFRTILMMK